MKIKTLWYFSKEASMGLSRNGLMSMAAIVTVTLSLIILGCFYIVIANFTHFADKAKGVLELRVYLKEEANHLLLQEKIIEFQGVKDVQFVSKEDGAKWLEKSLGVNNLFITSDNPLPDMIDVQITEDAKVKPLLDQLNSLEGIEEVAYGKTFVSAMLVIIRIIWIIGLFLIGIVGLVVLYIIINTIRLTVFARWREIEIMKLVGATDWFIRWPFMLEGIFIGICGSVITLLLLSKLYHLLFQYVKQAAPFIPLLSEQIINYEMFWLVFVVGVAFGAFGSMLSIKRFMKA